MPKFIMAAIAPLLIGACTPISTPVESAAARAVIQPANPALGILPQTSDRLIAYENRTPSAPGSWQGVNGAQSPNEGGSH